VALSLAPPRSPPHESSLRMLLTGRNPSEAEFYHHHPYPHPHHHYNDNGPQQQHHQGHDLDHDYAHYIYSNHSLPSRIHQILEAAHLLRLERKRKNEILPHPHLSTGPEVAQKMTRALGALLPLSSQNKFRDNGGFRSLADTSVLLSTPLIALTKPHAAANFLKLSKSYEEIRYGSHDMQRMELYLPSSTTTSDNDVRGLVFFVHGGAWGSGMPWMYRLVALPFLEELRMAVVIVGYRTYPDANVSEQVDDLVSAAIEFARVKPDLIRKKKKYKNNTRGGDDTNEWLGNSIIGHSSGAHIAFLMLLKHLCLKSKLIKSQRNKLKEKEISKIDMSSLSSILGIDFDSFVGLSGPYDISHHFDYEAGRGVEEISPMKPACGHSREDFHVASPAILLTKLIAMNDILEEGTVQNDDGKNDDNADVDSLLQQYGSCCPSMFLPRILMVHGMEDGTVPFTATSEAARILRSCGVTNLDELYLAQTGHEDTVMHFMLGGEAKDGTLKWLKDEYCLNGKDDSTATSKKVMVSNQSRL